ncbi:MAG TPA: hypothetical protein DHW82_14050 [Spirochaetia bacterium]|nr:MAG: hypothetical protein A2Y41_12005 [Spirochaetes bacterium GWB1_36_13]HCL58112.1 hypothetical protein [Spirochaetia bacterium]
MVQYDEAGEVLINNVSIHYEYFGKKNGPVIVFFNGVAMETASWYQFLPPVLQKFDVLLWDFRGQGKSTSDNNPYSIEEFADYLKAILIKLKLDPKNVNLLGVSFGAIVAAEFLRKHSACVNRAVLSGVIISPEKIYQYQAEAGKKILEMGLIDLWIDSLYTTLFSENFLRSIEPFIPKLKEALNQRYKNRISSLMRLLESEDKYVRNIENLYPEFKKVENQVLIIAGEHDRLTPPYVQKKAQKIFHNSQYSECSECGHIIYMEKPKEFFTQVADFFTK